MTITASASSEPTADKNAFVAAFNHFAEELESDKNAADANDLSILKSTDENFWNSRWIGRKSPWSPFLERQFIEALDKADIAVHARLIENGRCEQAVELEAAGFAAFYPQFENLFKNSDIRRVFETVIVRQFSYADQWCRARRILMPLAAEARIFKDGILMTLYAIKFEYHKPSHPVILDEDLINKARYTMRTLALCHYYRPALYFMAEYVAELHYVQTSGLVGYYYLYLSRKLGIPVPGFEKFITERRPGISPWEIHRIKIAFERYPLEQSIRKLHYHRMICWSRFVALP